jgi:hypothetical protein
MLLLKVFKGNAAKSMPKGPGAMFENNVIKNRRDILKLRSDLSPYLVHLTRNGPIRTYPLQASFDLPHGSVVSSAELDARTSLVEILNSRSILARSPFSYFNFKVRFPRPNGSILNPDSKVNREWLKSVCFTETPLDQVRVHCHKIEGRDLHFQPYGVVFSEQAVRKRVGNPIFYFESSSTIRSSLDSLASSQSCESMRSTLPYFEAFGKPAFKSNPVAEIDFRWEREWRVVGSFEFSLSDLVCVLCPESEFEFFQKLVGLEVKLVDPNWPEEMLKEVLGRRRSISILKPNGKDKACRQSLRCASIMIPRLTTLRFRATGAKWLPAILEMGFLS